MESSREVTDDAKRLRLFLRTNAKVAALYFCIYQKAPRKGSLFCREEQVQQEP